MWWGAARFAVVGAEGRTRTRVQRRRSSTGGRALPRGPSGAMKSAPTHGLSGDRWVGGAFGTLRPPAAAAASAERAARARQPRAAALVGRGVAFFESARAGTAGRCRCLSVQISGAEGIDSEKYFRERAWRRAPRQQEQEGQGGLGNARGLDCHPAFLLLGEAATGLSRAATLHREEACRSMTPEASPELATTPCCAALHHLSVSL